jgi:hypothetical protein
MRGSVGLAIAAWALATAAFGQVVQLPTYRTFGANTSVVVPDRGSVYLGGVARARSASSEFGVPLTPFRNRSLGSDLSVARSSVSVTIHDFAAMEEDLQRQALARQQDDPNRQWDRRLVGPHDAVQSRIGEATQRPAVPPAQFVPSDRAKQLLAQAAAIRERRQQAEAARARQAADLLRQGHEAEAAGHP